MIARDICGNWARSSRKTRLSIRRAVVGSAAMIVADRRGQGCRSTDEQPEGEHEDDGVANGHFPKACRAMASAAALSKVSLPP